MLGGVPPSTPGGPTRPPFERSASAGGGRPAIGSAAAGSRSSFLLPAPPIFAIGLMVVVSAAVSGTGLASAARVVILVAGGAGGTEPVGYLWGQLPPPLLLVLGDAPVRVAASSRLLLLMTVTAARHFGGIQAGRIASAEALGVVAVVAVSSGAQFPSPSDFPAYAPGSLASLGIIAVTICKAKWKEDGYSKALKATTIRLCVLATTHLPNA